jgi:hypothetical protein
LGCGDGGGRTKEVGRREFTLGKDGAAIRGISSVSYENIAFEGEAEKLDKR